MKEHMVRSRVFCSWNIKPRRNLNDWEIEEMGRLLEVLERAEIGDEGTRDELCWSLDEEKGFTVKSMYTALCLVAESSSLGSCVWNRLIQLKVSFFLWELWWDGLQL